MRSNVRRGIAALLAMIVAGVPGAARPQASGDPQLRQELDTLKEQLKRVEQQMRQQEELIRRLSGERATTPAPTAPPPVAAPAAPATPPSGTVAAPVAPVAPAPVAQTPIDAEKLRLRILEDLQPQLTAANKTFPSQFNPAIGFIIDTVFSDHRRNNPFLPDVKQTKSNFEFRSGEIGISASVDPFARAYAIINGTPDGVEVEEAAIVTTSLPWNLTVKGGRFFADFGRLSTFHDHDLPFVNRPLVLDRYIGGESQGDGVELSWLAPLPDHYLNLTVGAFNKIGGENDRVDNRIPRDITEFTFLARASTYFGITDALSLDVGVSNAYTPEVRAEEKRARNVLGTDFTLRYSPLASAAYRGLVWGTEILLNSENRPSTLTDRGFKYRDAWGMYSYLEGRLSRRFTVGFLYDYAQDIDPNQRNAVQYSPYLTIWPSEFQRIRLQYTRVEGPFKDDQFFLQWTAIIGSHVHTFRDR
jgi:hypothetical protein